MTFLLYFAPVAIALVALWMTLILIRAGQRYEQVLHCLETARENAIESGRRNEVEMIDHVLGLLTIEDNDNG